MRHFVKISLAVLALLSLVSSIAIIGCGDNEPSATKTLKIGWIADLTGSSSAFMRAGAYPAWEDAIKYANENDPVAKNVKVEMVYYDGKLDPNLDIQGYDYLRERGCVLLMSSSTAGQTLKTTVDQAKVFFLSCIATPEAVNPPGWVFCLPQLQTPPTLTILNWIAEKDWDYAAKGRKPKIGAVGPDDAYNGELQDAIAAYCQAHPDQFEVGPMRKTPYSAMEYSAEVAALKDCDYIFPPTTYTSAFFIQQYRAAGYTTAKFVGQEGLTAFLGYIVGQLQGWEGVDGTLVGHGTTWLSETSDPMVQEMLARIREYRPTEESTIKTAGSLGYASGYPNALFTLDLLREALKKVGGDPDKLTQQDLYDTAVGFSVDIREGPDWGWSETNRVACHGLKMYRWDASATDLKVVSDWLPIVEE